MKTLIPADYEINYQADPVNCYEIKYSDANIECARDVCFGDMIRGYDFTNGDGEYIEAIYMHCEEDTVVAQVVEECGLILPVSDRRFVYLDASLVEVHFFRHLSRDFTWWPKNKEQVFDRWTKLYSVTTLQKIAALDFHEFKTLAVQQGVDKWMMHYFALRRGNYELILDCDVEVRTKNNALQFLLWVCWKRCQEVYYA